MNHCTRETLCCRFRVIFALMAILCIPDMALALFEITPSVAVRETYNDNIFFTEEDSIDDAITTLSPGLEIVNRTEIMEARLSGRWDESYYDQYDELDSSDQRADARIEYRPSITTAFSAEAAYIEDSSRDRDINETGLLILSNAERQRKQLKVGGDHAWSEVDSFGLTFSYDQSEYDDPEFSDSIRRSAAATWSRDLSKIYRATFGRMSIGYDAFEFEDYQVSNSRATLGFLSNFSEAWSISLDVGVHYLETEYEESVVNVVEGPEPRVEIVTQNKTDKDWEGTGMLRINYRGETSDTALSLYQDVREAGGRGGVVNRTSLMFSTVHRLTETFRVFLSAEYFLNTAEAGKNSVEEIDEETLNLRPSLRWTVFRNMDVDVSYTYTWIQDDVDAIERHRNLVFVNLTLRQPLLNP